ncbi:MAG TPA: hypothetical protein VEG35_05035 [Burkholderiales bacterium]|nr:hypothetical protein [Burkholderiales bacterium]
MKIRGLLIVVLLAVVVVYFLYFAKSGNDKGLLQTEIEQLAKAKVTLTQANMAAVAREIIAYAAGGEGLPEDLKQVQRSRPSLGMGLLDAWSRAIRYERLSDTTFRLRSAGPDGVFDTADDIVKDF